MHVCQIDDCDLSKIHNMLSNKKLCFQTNNKSMNSARIAWHTYFDKMLYIRNLHKMHSIVAWENINICNWHRNA